MSEQMICNRGTLCEYPDCPAGQPHDPQFCRDCHGQECDARKPGRCVPVEPPVQMMICPSAGDYCACGGESKCKHLGRHKAISDCRHSVDDCPACVPVDQAPPFYGWYFDIVRELPERAIDLGDIGEFKPVDLGLIREQLSGHVIALVSTDMISAMCDEIEWLRGCHNQSSAEALVLSLRNGRLRDDVAALVAERDELRQTIASNRAAFLQMVDEVTK